MRVFVPFSWPQHNPFGIGEILWGENEDCTGYDPEQILLVMLVADGMKDGFAVLRGIHWDAREEDVADEMIIYQSGAEQIQMMGRDIPVDMEEGYLVDEIRVYGKDDFIAFAIRTIAETTASVY